MIKFLAVSMLLVGATSVYAQDKPVTLGVKAGFNISSMTGDDADGIDSKTGFLFGVTVDVNIAPQLYLMTGLDYTTKGGKTVAYYYLYENLHEGKMTMNLNYLQLPVHIGYKVAASDKVNIVFRGGPYLAYGAGGKTELKFSDLGKGKTNSFDDNWFKRFDLGAGLGVGAEFGKIGVNLGYDFGLIKISNMQGLPKIKNNNFSVAVGYKF